MFNLILRPGHTTAADVTLAAAGVLGFQVQLFPGHTMAADVVLRGSPFYQAVVDLVAESFPTQYAGLRTFYGGLVKELCLVAKADAATGMGAAPIIDKNGTLYAVYVVETSDLNASSVRVNTSGGVKALRLKT